MKSKFSSHSKKNKNNKFNTDRVNGPDFIT